MKTFVVILVLILSTGCATATALETSAIAFNRSAAAFDKSATALAQTATAAEQGIAGVASSTEELLSTVRLGIAANESSALSTTASIASATGELALLLKDLRGKTETPLPRSFAWLIWLGGVTLAVLLLHSLATHLHLWKIVRVARKDLGLA